MGLLLGLGRYAVRSVTLWTTVAEGLVTKRVTDYGASECDPMALVGGISNSTDQGSRLEYTVRLANARAMHVNANGSALRPEMPI